MNKSTKYLGAAVVLQWCMFFVLWYHFGFWVAQAIIVYPALIGILAGLGAVHAYKEFQESVERFAKAPAKFTAYDGTECTLCGARSLDRYPIQGGVCEVCLEDAEVEHWADVNAAYVLERDKYRCPRCGITMLVQHANGLCTLCQPDPLKFLDEPERPTSLA